MTKTQKDASDSTLTPLLAKLESRSWGVEVAGKARLHVEAIKAQIAVVHAEWSDQTLLLKGDDTKFDGTRLKEQSKELADLYSQLEKDYLSDARALK